MRGTYKNQSTRHQYSPIAEEDEEPATRKLDALERELRELRAPREQHVLGIHHSGTKKAQSSSPTRLEREYRISRRIDEIEQSPQFNGPALQDSIDITELERQRKNLKNELKEMYGLEDSRHELSRHYEESFSGLKASDAAKRDHAHFENIFDKYTDKMLQESSPFEGSNRKPLASEGKLKFEDFGPSSTKKTTGYASKLNEDASRARDIFKVESPSRAKFDVLEELSQRSNKSLIESFTEDNNPKPIVFTKKETVPKKEAPKPEPKKVVKEDPPSTISNKNLPKLGELSLPKSNKPAEKSSGLALPDLKPKGKFQEEPKKPQQRTNAAIDSILGDQRKLTDEIDFEEIDEEIFDL
jgi:hypothetical protein